MIWQNFINFRTVSLGPRWCQKAMVLLTMTISCYLDISIFCPKKWNWPVHWPKKSLWKHHLYLARKYITNLILVILQNVSKYLISSTTFTWNNTYLKYYLKIMEIEQLNQFSMNAKNRKEIPIAPQHRYLSRYLSIQRLYY